MTLRKYMSWCYSHRDKSERFPAQFVTTRMNERLTKSVSFFISPMRLKTGRDLMIAPNREIAQKRLFISRNSRDHPGQVVAWSDFGRRRLLKPVGFNGIAALSRNPCDTYVARRDCRP